MKFISSLATLAALAAAALPCLAGPTSTVKVTYNTLYDNPTWSLDNTACSNGPHGLDTKWSTLGAIPNYPNVGGIPGLAWNSPLCGTCWELTYQVPGGPTSTIAIVAVDSGYDFDIAENAFSTWAGSEGVAAGFVYATATQVAPAACGLP